MEKCLHCESEDLTKIRLVGYGGISAYPTKENGKVKNLSLGAPVWGMLCKRCGTVSRLFVDEKYIWKFEKEE